MTDSGIRRARRIGAIAGITISLGLFVYWLIQREREGAQPVVAEPICSIRFLTTEERLSIANRLLETGEIEEPFPMSQVDNPVLHPGRCAVVQFQNVTAQPITVYSLHEWPVDPDVLKSNNEMAIAIRNGTAHTFGNARRKAHLLKSLENAPSPPSIRTAFVVDEEIRDVNGNVVQVYDLSQSIVFPGHKVPPAVDLLARNPLSFTIEPGGVVELPVSILGKFRRRSDGLVSGSYTMRATISYAEAPSGETRRITSEPVTITVTEEHIKAAEAYWAAAKN
jgi:hypothetical protein